LTEIDLKKRSQRHVHCTSCRH